MSATDRGGAVPVMRGRLPFYYAGSVILLALLLGGGTRQELWSDKVVWLWALPAVVVGFWRLPLSRLPTSTRWLVVLVLATLAVPLLPLGQLTGAPDPAPLLLTADAGRTLESVLHALVLLGFALFVAGFDDVRQERLLGFLLLGVLANMVAAATQLSYDRRAVEADLLPFVMTAGTMANENHFATLCVLTIPVFAFLFLARARRPLLYAAIAGLVVFLLFALGSRAGMAASVAAAFFCYVWFSGGMRISYPLLMTALIAAGLALLLPTLEPSLLGADLRVEIFERTRTLIGDVFPLGTGAGTFRNVYAAALEAGDARPYFINHAHNDYLEALLEWGWLMPLLLAPALIVLVRGALRSYLSGMAAIGVVIVLGHSAIDYPLRTLAVGVVFAYLFAIIASLRPAQPARRQEAASLEAAPAIAHPAPLPEPVAAGAPAGGRAPLIDAQHDGRYLRSRLAVDAAPAVARSARDGAGRPRPARQGQHPTPVARQQQGRP